MPQSLLPRAALLSALLLGAAGVAAAQQRPPAEPDTPGTRLDAATVAEFLGGGLTGLVVHEAGHIVTGFAFGADPGFKRLDYGFIPFFAVTHQPVSRGREFVISASGFLAQHGANEWLLSHGPPLRQRSSAFRKGWLTFNLATSAVYTVAAFGRFGPPERDTRGIADNAGRDGVPEPVVGALILVPAALDGVRYVYDDPAWARWTSRAVKAGLLLLAVR